jgi:hypothetical protein
LISSFNGELTIANGGQTLCCWGYLSRMSVSHQHPTQIPPEVKCLATYIIGLSPIKGRNQYPGEIPPEANMLVTIFNSVTLAPLMMATNIFALQVFELHVCFSPSWGLHHSWWDQLIFSFEGIPTSSVLWSFLYTVVTSCRPHNRLCIVFLVKSMPVPGPLSGSLSLAVGLHTTISQCVSILSQYKPIRAA